MTISIENEYQGTAVFPGEERIREIAEQVILAALDHENCPYECEVGLTLVDDDTIREINREHRNLDKSTDVLSFPMVDYEIPGNFDFLESADGSAFAEDAFNPDSGELMLGDIVISVDHAAAQAELYGHSTEREFAFLIAHSMLHLMGYDHMTPEEAAVMERYQEEILEPLGFVRPAADLT